MEDGRKFGANAEQFRAKRKMEDVTGFDLAPNGKLIIRGEARKKSAPVPGTSRRKNANQGRKGR